MDGISFSVERGEVFGLLGTNGAGKTTTLDVLEGYRAPTGGQVRVMGCDPAKDRGVLAPRVGIMLQSAGFFDTLTVEQTVRAWRLFYPRPRPADEALAIVGLTGRERVRVGKLSGGERRWLDLTLALLGSPELLYLDEPTTGMDPEARTESLQLIRRIVDDGTTVVLTTHYLDEAELLADRVVIMHKGRIVREGTVTTLRAEDGRSRISFELDPELVDLLPVVGTITAERRAGQSAVWIDAPEPQAALTRLLGWAAQYDVGLRNRQIRSTSLQDLFLEAARDTTQTDTYAGSTS